MFTYGTDFACDNLHGVYVCQVKAGSMAATAKQAFVDLQTLIRKVSSLLATVRTDVPPGLTTIIVDGRPGPTTALGAQMIVAAFGRTVPVPPALAPLVTAGTPDQDIIKLTAANAAEINSYINDVITNHPEALRALQVDAGAHAVANAAGVPQISLQTLGLITGGVLLVVGGVYLFRRMEREHAGLDDKSYMLPESDEPDEDDDDDEDEDDTSTVEHEE